MITHNNGLTSMVDRVLRVTDGVLTVECHDHVQEIHRGQVYKFETDQPHLYRNDGDRVASCMCFFLDYTNIR